MTLAGPLVVRRIVAPGRMTHCAPIQTSSAIEIGSPRAPCFRIGMSTQSVTCVDDTIIDCPAIEQSAPMRTPPNP